MSQVSEILGDAVQIDASGLHYKALGKLLKSALDEGADRVDLRNVCGQRYIGTGAKGKARVDIYGTPGNDLASFMQGLTIHVHGNAQDGCGNTLDGGELVVHGHAGDIVGYSMRGGKIFVRDGVGYRAAIHMKEFMDRRPALVTGGSAQPFMGEYMAGGTVVVLGLDVDGTPTNRAASFVGTGMHGGVMYIRGTLHPTQLGKEVGVEPIDDPASEKELADLILEYCAHFGRDPGPILASSFIKVYARYLRPYGKLYAY